MSAKYMLTINVTNNNITSLKQLLLYPLLIYEKFKNNYPCIPALLSLTKWLLLNPHNNTNIKHHINCTRFE